MNLSLTGDNNTPAMPMTDAQVNHLRRLLAWIQCEKIEQVAFLLINQRCFLSARHDAYKDSYIFGRKETRRSGFPVGRSY